MLRAFLLALCKAALIFFGLFIVAALIPFRRTDESTRLLNGWVFADFGTWWGNPFDGLHGDKRMDYGNDCITKDWGPFRTMWHWAAWRNPVNKWSRLVAGCDMSQCVVTKRIRPLAEGDTEHLATLNAQAVALRAELTALAAA